MRPRVDDLVVALTVRDVARHPCALEPFDALRRFLKERLLLGGDVQVLDADRDSTARSVAESEVLQAVEEGYGARQAGSPIRLEDQLAKRLLLHVAVLVGQTLGDDRVEHRTPCGRPDPVRALDLLR